MTLQLDDADLRVDADRTRLVQVVTNLLDNAAKYTPQGGSIALSVRGHGGLGLGLALVKSLVQLHGGQVHAASAGLGQGSTFSVILDVAAGAAPAADVPGTTAAARARQVAGSGRRILIVDDNTDAAQSLREILAAFGHGVATAATPWAGLSLAAGDWPEVFILDIGLPDIDGLADLTGVIDGAAT